MKGSGLLASALGACLSAVLGCHRFEACGPGVACESAGARGGDGGASGTGGEGDPRAGCAGSFANCDLAAANACEVDLTRDPRHCSECNAACTGICNEGECMPFEVAATDQVNPVGGIVLTSDFAYFAAERAAGGAASLRLQRVARRDLSERQSLAEGHWSSIAGLAVTSQKLYVLGDYDLFSLKLPDASEVVVEPSFNDSFIESIDAQGRYLYVSDYWSVYQREEGDDRVTRVFHSPEATGVRVAATSAGFFVFVASEQPSAPPRYEVLFTTHGVAEPAPVAAGEGSISVFSAFEGEAYFVVDDGQSFTLRQASDFESEKVLATDAEHFTGLAASFANLVGAVSEHFYSGLHVFYPLNSELVYEWPTHGAVLAPEADADGELWYFDEASASLVRHYPYRLPVRP